MPLSLASISHVLEAILGESLALRV
uniref:Uncharacterized protein n=1 Tax=Rhizophora mucronata TaxID=61149 RepID=A0A2P2QLQ7_RHIMU